MFAIGEYVANGFIREEKRKKKTKTRIQRGEILSDSFVDVKPSKSGHIPNGRDLK